MAADDLDPLAFPGYRLVVGLGGGGNGRVWRAREIESQRLVAMKIYHPERLSRTGFLTSLDAAVVAARGFSHPAAGAVYGLVEARSGGAVALVMELAGGELLGRALQRNVRFAVPRALRLVGQLADALTAAHAAGLTGGYLHPGHVVISGESAKLLGLGWSAVEGLPDDYRHLPEEGRFAPAVYAAPELLSLAHPDAASDVFGLGALLYHMLTGLPPFRARDLAGLKLERAEGLRWPRGADSVVPVRVIGLTGRMLELDRALRPAAAEVAGTIAGLLSAPAADCPAAPALPRTEPPAGAPAALEMPPADSPAVLGVARPASRLQDALLGAVAATLLLGAGILLGRLIWSGDRPAGPPPADTAARTPAEPASERPAGTGEAPAGPGGAEDRAVEAALGEALAALELPDAAGRRAARTRLAELAARGAGDAWGQRARTRLAELAAEEERVRRELLAGLLRQAEELAGTGRYGAAMTLLASPPPELAGTALAEDCARRAEALRGQAEKYFADLAARAERSAADGDLKAAILDYQEAAERLGLDGLVERARRRARELGEEQERLAARAAGEREEARRAAGRAALARAVAAAQAHAAAFRYGQAGAELAGPSGDAGLAAADRELAAAYSRLLAEEAELFARAARRVADGSRQLTISQGGPEILTVKRMDEKGMTAESDSIRVTFLWSQVPDAQIHRAIKLTVDMTDAGEQLALAGFAWHHGQRLEMENGLSLAAELDPAMKERAAERTRLFTALEALVAPRRAEPPTGEPAPPPSPRRNGG